MRRYRRYTASAATVLLALLVLAVALRSDEDGPTPAPPVVTTADPATVPETTGATDPGETGATTAARTETGGSTVTGMTATGATTGTAPVPPYALAPTRNCLRSAGFAVSAIRSADARLRALGDLAQSTSLEVRLEGRTLGLAFGDTRLLASLLRVPNDPYRMEVRRNALLMYRPAARNDAAVVRSCLRS